MSKKLFAADEKNETNEFDPKNYSVKKIYGTLTVTKAKLTVTTLTAKKAFDGKPLTAEGTVDGLVNRETVTLKMTGSQTEVGSSLNTYQLVWDGTALEANYDVEDQLGTLEVTKAQKPNDPNDDKDKDKNKNGKTGTKKPHDPKSSTDQTHGNKPAKAAQTGDQFDIMIYMMLMLTAMAVMIVMVVWSRRRRDNE